MNSWDIVRQDIKFRQKIQSVKSTLPKITHAPPSATAKRKPVPQTNSTRVKTAPKPQNTSGDAYRNQSYLKHLLTEFGLSQYLRKLFDLGYDDSNLYKLGKLHQKDFEQLCFHLKIFPGHQVKMQSFYEYIQQLYLSKKLTKPHTSTGNRRINNTANNKRINTLYNVNNNGIHNYNINSSGRKNMTPNEMKQTARPYSNMNKMISSFMNGDFGYNYYLSDNNQNQNVQNIQNMQNNLNNINISNYNINNNNAYTGVYGNQNNYPLSAQSEKINMGINYNNEKFDMHNLNENDQYDNDDNPSEDIDKLLKTYMIQLNEKLDDSYDSIEDSSLSHIILTTNTSKIENKKEIEDGMNKKNKSNVSDNAVTKNNRPKELAKLPNYNGSNANSNLNINNSNKGTNGNIVNPPLCSKPIKLPSISKIGNTNNNSSNQNSQNNNNLIKTKDNINAENKQKQAETNNVSQKVENKNTSSSNTTVSLPITNIKNNEIKLAPIKPIEQKDKNTNNINTNKSDNTVKKEEKKEPTTVPENTKKESKPKEDEKKEQNEEYEDDYKFEDEEIKEDNFEIEENDYLKKKIETEDNPLLDENINLIKSEEIATNIEKEKPEPQIAEQIESEKIEEKKENLENKNKKDKEKTKTESSVSEKYTAEQLFYENLRLNKSSDGDYLRQNLNQFDIEYMCRCLGLAIMKHIESGKDKSHITELLNDTEKFNFFNSLYNSKFEFIFNFFNKTADQQKMSNLDRLDFEEYNNNKKIKDNKSNNLNINDIRGNDNISFLKHIKKGNDEALIKKSEEKINKFHSNFADIEKDIKFIDEFFSIGQRKKNYQDLSEKTKDILSKELSYINEVSNDNSKINSTILNPNNISNNENLNISNSKNQGYENLLRKSMQQIINKEEIEENKKENEEIEDENYEDEFNEENIEEEIDKKEEDQKLNNVKEPSNKVINENNVNPPKEGNKEKEKEASAPNDKDINFDIINSKFNSVNIKDQKKEPSTSNNEIINEISTNNNETKHQNEEPKINEEIPNEENEEKEVFESGEMESNYVIDASTVDKLKDYIIKQAEVYDDDYFYPLLKIQRKKYVPPPDPQQIFDFCANIMILTKMEKEVIIITLIYLERLIFNTGLLLTSRNWRRATFTAMIIASKIWDDDSFENNHFAQVFTHLKIGEINLLERTFLELINYKVYVKCSEYFKYFFIIKSIALKYNFNGMNIVPISVERMMKIQEYAFQMQKKMRKKYSLSNSM